MKVIKNDHPAHLLTYLANVVKNEMIAAMLLTDEYIFATYFTAVIQGLVSSHDSYDELTKIVSNHIPFDFSETHEIAVDVDKQERMMKIVDNLRAQFNEQVTTTYVRDFFFSIAVYRALAGNQGDIYGESIPQLKLTVHNIVQETQRRQQGKTSITANLERLQDLLGMTLAETRLLELNFFLSTDVRAMIFRDFLFSVTKNPSTFDLVYKTMLGHDLGAADKSAVDYAFSGKSIPISMGIVSYDQKTKKLSQQSEFWCYAISNYADSEERFFSRFVEKMKDKKRSFSGAIAKIQSTQDEALIEEFLTAITANKFREKQHDRKPTETSVGNNILFYGGRNLDKLGFIYDLLKRNNLEGYQVKISDAKFPDIPAVCLVAQKYLDRINKNGMAVLVIDKAEQALSKQRNRPSWYVDMFGDDALDQPKTEDLDSDEALLINNPVPSIWMTSSVSGITAENVGRFLIHCELRGGSRKDRREEVQKVCDELGFSTDIAQQLSMYYELNTEQVKSAARTTSFLNHKGEEGEKTLVHLIGNSQKALDREKTEQLRASVTHYDLGLLNLSGTLSPARIIEALKRNPMGTMCFYGLPGTGKTALAEHIAMQLDMPITIKPASELLSMWLGESEKNIAKMFEEAKAEGSILLLDEADSFLRDRSLAQRSWEVTQVNELLQRMERFPGIFICATNLFQSLDAAALRRFTFKLEFLALTPEQRLKMLVTESGVDLSKLDEAQKEDLMLNVQLIRYLTPGDFATVKRQANLFGETLSVDEWLRRLEVEAKAKLVGLSRNSYNMEEDPRGGEVTPRKKGE